MSKRLKTSFGYVRLAEVNGKINHGDSVRLEKISTMGTELYNFLPKTEGTKNNKGYIGYDLTGINADNVKNIANFSFISSNRKYFMNASYISSSSTKKITYKLNDTNLSDYFSAFDINSNYLYGMTYKLQYSDLPIHMIFVQADENIGTYTKCMIGCCGYNSYNKFAFYTMINFSPLLPLLNDESSYIAEPDSTPVSDDNGIFDDSSDIIELPDISSINLCSALATSCLHCHKLTADNISSLFSKFWSSDFFDTIIKNQQAPIDNIVSLSTFPFSVQDNGISENVTVGTVDMGITAPIVSSQFQEIDFGEINCAEYYGNSLDYSNTDADIFLPFIGTKSLDVNAIGNSIIHLVYRVDILTGNCDAIISVKRSRDNTNLNSVLYIFSGNLQNQIPLTQQQNQSLLKLENALQTTIQGSVMGNPKGGMAGGVAGLAAEGMTMALTGQPTTRYQMTGNLSTANGYMGVLTPYLIWYRPVNVKPKDYNKYYGYPSFFTRKLSECKGYTKIHELISDAPTEVPVDDWEKIKQMLKDGIIIN